MTMAFLPDLSTVASKLSPLRTVTCAEATPRQSARNSAKVFIIVRSGKCRGPAASAWLLRLEKTVEKM